MIWKDENIKIEHLNKLCKQTIAEHIGIQFTEIGDDYLTATMPVDHRTIQPYGRLHGGASAVLAETIGSVASYLCIDKEQNVTVGLEINCNHIRGVKSGIVIGTARPFHIGKTTQVWEIKIVNELNKLVCISRLTIAVIPKNQIG